MPRSVATLHAVAVDGSGNYIDCSGNGSRRPTIASLGCPANMVLLAALRCGNFCIWLVFRRACHFDNVTGRVFAGRAVISGGRDVNDTRGIDGNLHQEYIDAGISLVARNKIVVCSFPNELNLLQTRNSISCARIVRLSTYNY